MQVDTIFFDGFRQASSKYTERFVLSYQYPKKKERSLSFCIRVNIKVFHKLLLSFLTGAAKHAQIIQNKKFPIS